MITIGSGRRKETGDFTGGRTRRNLLKSLKPVLLALSLFLLVPAPAPAPAGEGPGVEWENTLGWPGYRDRVIALSQAGDGGYVTVVEKRPGVDWRRDTHGTVSACAIKVDANGKKVWEKVLAEDCDGVGGALQTDDGGLIIGLTPEFSYRMANESSRNITIIKVNPAGDKVWEKTFGGEKDDYMTSMEKTGDGGCLIAGSSNSFSAGGDYDAYLIRISNSGEKVWEKTFGGAGDDNVQVVREAGDGGCLMAGRTCAQRSGDDNIYLVKTDSSGNRVWEKTVGGRGPDFIKEMRPTGDGGWILAGTTGSFQGWENIYLFKVDASGQLAWERSLGGDNHDYGVAVRQTGDGGFVVLGDTRPFGEGSSARLIKTNALGEKVWERTFEDKEYVWGSHVQQSGDGGYIIAGGEVDYHDGSNIYIIKTDSDGNRLWKKELGRSIAEPWVFMLPAGGKGYIITAITNTEERWGDIYMARLGPEESDQKETGPPVIKVYLNFS
ncbi:MAG: PQQ-binding-like beta-propeller repeat protein [Bacillota bacterium]